MKLYWGQHKVFFVATLALFPDKLNGHEVNELFYAPYFIGRSTDFIGLELEEYRKAGYLKYEKPGALYKITDINTKKAAKDLTQYLKEWQQSNLVSLSASKPPDPAYQQELLLDAIVRARANHQSEPRITLENVYGERGDYAYEPPFWELTLSYQLLDNKVVIKDVGYDQRIDGLYEDNVQPFVDYEIVNKRLLDLVQRRVTQKSEPVSSPVLSGNKTFKANIIIMNRIIYAALDDGREYRVSRQLRTEMSPHMFINHVLHHPRANINRHDIKEVTGSSDITELVRRCGFDESLKKIFFPDTTEQKVYFQPTPELTEAQVKLLAEHKWDKVRKGGIA